MMTTDYLLLDYIFPTTRPVEGEKPSDEYMNFKVTASMMWLSLKVWCDPDNSE